MDLGVDIGTSSVKAVILNEAGQTEAEASAPLTVSQPKPLWSEQDPAAWVTAAEKAVLGLPAGLRARVQALSFSGQMHGAVVLGADDQPLRPAILWNDGRAFDACRALELAEPRTRAITGNKAMPGFTAPKLWWLREHEPEIFAAIRRVLLPKDYVRLAWTGEAVSDCSDAAGTLWLDVAARDWSSAMLVATELPREAMPRLVEGTEESARLLKSVADRLGIPAVPVAGGGGDQAAGAIGAGIAKPGQASLALGTSGVLFTVTEAFAPKPDRAVHAFCHAVPDTWHQMAVILAAASAVDYASRLAGFNEAAAAYASAEAAQDCGSLFFHPYISGERTPLDDPHATASLLGLTADTAPGQIVQSALEGVAFAFAEGFDALLDAGGNFREAVVIGGGARSLHWGQILADALDRPLIYRANAATGPAQGAAFLARMMRTGQRLDEVFPELKIEHEIDPNPGRVSRFQEKRATWRTLFEAVRPFIQPRST